MLEELKGQVCDANRELMRSKLVIYTWGNVSGYDRERQLMVIKPSGVAYESLRPEDMVVLNMAGSVIEGTFKPSSDTATHLEVYRSFPLIGGIVHTHSHWATVWAQSNRALPCFGTTHADHFNGSIPITRSLRRDEIETEYEANTGRVIVETFLSRQQGHEEIPAILVRGHGPFCWGETAMAAVHNAVVLEEICKMAFHTSQLSPRCDELDPCLQDKHFQRKNGGQAYYGQ